MQKEKLKALINGDDIVDITSHVQTITATHKDTGVVSKGNGIVIARFNHINGHMPVFLSLKGESFAFGQWLDNYTFTNNWKSLDSSDYEWSCENIDNNVGLDLRYAKSICAIS